MTEELAEARATIQSLQDVDSRLELSQSALALELKKVEDLQGQVDSLSRTIAAANDKLVAKDVEIAELRADLAERIREAESVAEEQVSELKARLHGLEIELQEVRATKSSLESSCEVANEKLGRAVEKLKALVVSYESKAEECSTLYSEMGELRVRNSELVEAAAEREAQLRSYEESMVLLRELQAKASTEEHLKAEVRRLADEYAGSQDAFEKYRIRAKKSLSEMAVVQRDLEARLSQRDQETEALSERLRELERRLKVSEEAASAAIEEYKGYMAKDRAQIEDLRALLAGAKERLSSVHLHISEDYKTEEARLREELEVSRARSLSLQQALEAAEARLAEANERENGLLAEMRKRGDLARQILLKKEEEIKALSAKGDAQTKKVANTGITEPRTPAPPAGQGSTLRDAALWDEKSKYLRKAFAGFVTAEGLVQMQSLGRVICAILDMDAAEQAAVMEAIGRIWPGGGGALESLSSLIMGSPAKR